jgi:hypothetical protein
MEKQQYYNAKPSKVANIGIDIAGAKRMHFDTYETVEERQAKEARKVKDKRIATIKEELKEEILSEVPRTDKIISLKASIFELEHGFNPTDSNSRTVIAEKRALAIDRETREAFNKTVNSYNKFLKERSAIAYSPSYFLRKARAKYGPKQSFTEKSGMSYNWNQFKPVESVPTVVNFLAANTSAIQFGNSVTDNERAYICEEMQKFLITWSENECVNAISLKPIKWSFGARGKAGSVAYYQATGKVISVNRNNIGSLIHEIGHYIDDVAGRISSKISFKTVNEYRESIKTGLDSRSLQYYCKRSEIFARAFEAYCYSVYSGFDAFAQSGKDYLPQLSDELIGLIKEALKQN